MQKVWIVSELEPLVKGLQAVSAGPAARQHIAVG